MFWKRAIVGILILVDKNIAESVLVFEQHLGEIAQQNIGIEEQIVEIHRHGIAKTTVVELVYLTDHRLFGRLVGLLDFRVCTVVLRPYQAAFGHRDAAKHITRIIDLRVEIHRLDNLLDGRLAIIVVVDGEGVGVAQFVGLSAQDAGKDGVEGAHPEVTGFIAYQLGDTFLHFGRSLVCKCQSQYVEAVDAELDKMSYAICKGSGLAASGTGNNHYRAFRAGCRVALGFVEL